MDSISPNSGPVCLIETTDQNEFQVNPEALNILSEIHEPVVVVAIAGMYRTGKSYLMNRLAGKTSGFPLGSTIESKTKGIWMWCIPHPSKPEHTLILLDTEGLGDVQKGDRKHDTWIFCLAVLLSSTLVYNSIGTIDNFAVDNLHLVTELADYIKVQSSEESDEDDCNLVQFFPHFVWVVRDMTLKLEMDNCEVTADQYLEKGLELKKGVKKTVMEYNMPRLCIRKYFPSRKCFTLVRPVSGNDLDDLESVAEQQLDPLFLEGSQSFCDYIFNNAPVKMVKGGHNLNGKLFGILIQTYIKTIQSGNIPCMENAVLAMAMVENEQALLEGLCQYQSEMEKKVKLPTEDKDLSEIHKACERDALEIFMKKSFKDENHTYQKRFVDGVGKIYSSFLERNESTSSEICQTLLQNLSADLEKNLDDGVYSQPGGFQHYTQDRDQVVQSFNNTPNKGIKAEKMLSLYLEGRSGEAESILQADISLTDAQKKLNEEKEKAAILEQNQKYEEERRIQAEQRLKDQEQTHQENFQQLRIKMEKETEKLRMEIEAAMNSKLREQEKLLSQGFKEHADTMAEEIKGG
ncbi:guanylate-binding protein 6-like [Discoglossus pictus]